MIISLSGDVLREVITEAIMEAYVDNFTPYTPEEREMNFLPFTDRDKRTPQQRNPAYAKALERARNRKGGVSPGVNEAYKSDRVRSFMGANGGFDKNYSRWSYIGDVEDDDINYWEEFDDVKDAIGRKHDLRKPNPYTRERSDNDKRSTFRVYKSNNGRTALVGLDRNRVHTQPTIGPGELPDKMADRYWRNEKYPGNGSYVDDSDTYYYHSPARDFGATTNRMYKSLMGQNAARRSAMTDDDWKHYQQKRLDRMDDYIGRNYPDKQRKRNKRT